MALSAITQASPQRLPYRAALNLEISWKWPFYGDPRVRGQALVFRGEPLLVEIGVTTRFPGAGRAGAELDWPTRVEVKWRSGGMFDDNPSERLSVECQQQPFRTYNAHSLNDYIELEPGGYQFIRCRVPDEALARLSAGQHTISVDWAIGSGGQAFREDRGTITPKRPLLGYDIEFELRDVQTTDDELDRTNQMAARAFRYGDLSTAVELASAVLRRKPASIVALSTRALAYAAQRACDLALADWEKAALAIERYEDPGNRFWERREIDNTPPNATRWRAEARTLGCQ